MPVFLTGSVWTHRRQHMGGGQVNSNTVHHMYVNITVVRLIDVQIGELSSHIWSLHKRVLYLWIFFYLKKKVKGLLHVHHVLSTTLNHNHKYRCALWPYLIEIKLVACVTINRPENQILYFKALLSHVSEH